MKNLAKKIDRILQIEPSLNESLLPIKAKWEKSHRSLYWEQLIKILNVKISQNHPQRSLIQNLFVPRKVEKKLYTFEAPYPDERIIGVIPENLEGYIRRYDLLQIKYAKMTIEATMTHNRSLMIELLRKKEILDIEQKKIWIKIKDHFGLRDIFYPVSFFIRIKDKLLVLTSSAMSRDSDVDSNDLPQENPSNSVLIKMTQDTFKKFILFINSNPPPGAVPPSSKDA